MELSHNFMNHIISDIFSGCGVAVKVGIFSSYSAQYFVKIVKECLKVNRFDPDLVQVVTGLLVQEEPTSLKRRDVQCMGCLLYTSPSPRDKRQSRMPSSA